MRAKAVTVQDAGRKGGLARAKNLTKAELSEIGRKGHQGYLASRESDKAAAREKVKEGKGEADGR